MQNKILAKYGLFLLDSHGAAYDKQCDEYLIFKKYRINVLEVFEMLE